MAAPIDTKLLAGRRRQLLFALLATLIVIIASPRSASAEVGSEKGGELFSIEKRDLMGTHELSVLLGALPLDAFAKGLTLQGSYTYHFTHLIGWELIGGTYAFNFETGLEQSLRERFDVQPEKEPRLIALLQSNFVFKPLYGKLSVVNNKLLTSELFFVLGPALGFFEGNSVPFGVDFGAGLRFFVGRYFSVRFDIRNYMLLPGFSSIENHLYLSLGLSLTFGFAEDEDRED